MSDERASESTARFGERAELYVKHRPGYPPEVLAHLREHCGLTPEAVVADVGSGTGILTRILLDNGNRVFAVEPNRKMREFAEKTLGSYPGFVSVDATAESTGLSPGSLDFVIAAQAFHWFRPEPTRREFARILRPGGWIVLIWNRRKVQGSAFLEEYERLLVRLGIDYAAVDHRKVVDSGGLTRFFGAGGHHAARFDNRQVLDWEGLRGRLLSSSYVPMPGHPDHDPMIRELRQIFDATEVGGTVRIDYDTEVYSGIGDQPGLD